MSGALQFEEAESNTLQATGTDGVTNLKQVAAERLAAHRNRRAAIAAQEAELEARTRQHRDPLRQTRRDDQRRGASVVRDTVMARYERRESYREFLAAEAERAIAQAQAEAEVAARSAKAVAEAQMQLLQELDRINQPDPGPREEAFAQVHAETRGQLAHALADIALGARELMEEPPLLTVVESPKSQSAPTPAMDRWSEPAIREVSAAGLTVRLFEDMPSAPARVSEVKPYRGGQPFDHAFRTEEEAADLLTALEEEIDFRRAPEFAPTVLETTPIPGNLIEFPRELVAPRRARPRLAEGPLLDEAGQPQLRIFEVDAVQVAAEPEPIEPAGIAEWQSLLLEGPMAEPAAPPADAQAHLTLPPQTAPLERRLMATAVDLCLVGPAWIAAGAAAVEVAGPALRSLSLPLAAISGVVSFAIFAVLYQTLFFTLSESTPGMRYARIALCTFGDGNPSRRAMRRRVFSTVLAACPLGLGLAWTLLDNDGLGWHDRMSRMYQRAY